MAIFIPEKKGAPASARIYTVGEDYNGASSPLATKQFFKADTAIMTWSPTGNAVVVQTSCDASNAESYYGDSGLHMLQAQTGESCTVPLTKEGPVHDVKWAPNGRTFVTIAGFMPAHCTLHHGKSWCL